MFFCAPMDTKNKLLVVACMGLVWSSSAEAQTPQSGRRHTGFFLRLSAGLGGTHASLNTEPKITLTGPGLVSSVAIGGALTENFILHADFFGGTAFSPKIKQGGREIGTINADLSLSGLGIGVTYYVMPMNLYLSGSVGFGVGTLEVTLGELSTDVGFAGSVMVGKEWWVSDEWGLGVAGQFMYMRLPDQNVDVDGLAGGILFSATYN